MPDRRYIFILLDEPHGFCQSLESDGETHDCSTRKRLNQLLRLRMTRAQPLPNVWHQPSLAARISKRAPLRDGGHVDYFQAVLKCTHLPDSTLCLYSTLQTG